MSKSKAFKKGSAATLTETDADSRLSHEKFTRTDSKPVTPVCEQIKSIFCMLVSDIPINKSANPKKKRKEKSQKGIQRAFERLH